MTQAKPQRVVLVAENGEQVGTVLRRYAHNKNTQLHLGVHIYLFDGRGRLLLTRRSLDKTVWPGAWSNSSSGHPRPGESAEQAAHRTVLEELGVVPDELVEAVSDFRYAAKDSNGLAENELCSVLVGRIDPEDVDPNPDDVAETSWVKWKDIQRVAATTPGLLSPWAVRQIPLLAELDVVSRLPRSIGQRLKAG